MTDNKKKKSRGTTKPNEHCNSYSNELRIDDHMNEWLPRQQRHRARNINGVNRFSSQNKQYQFSHHGHGMKSRRKSTKSFQGNTIAGRSSHAKHKQRVRKDDKFKNPEFVTTIDRCDTSRDNIQLNNIFNDTLNDHTRAPAVLNSTKPKVTSSYGTPTSNSSSRTQEYKSSSGTYKPSSGTQECKSSSGTHKPASGIHTSLSKQKSKGNNSEGKESSREVDKAVKITRSEIKKSKRVMKHSREPENQAFGEKDLSSQKSQSQERRKEHVISTIKRQMDDGTTASLRRYALYRSMINRLSDFLSNKQATVSMDSGEPTDDTGSVAPWDHDDVMYEKMHACKKLNHTTIPRLVSEPDIAPNKWDLMGTYFPKRIYIRETVNDCVIDEVVDIKSEKDWDILTYMSPLRHVNVTHRRKGKSRDLSFADLKDFQTYTYAYPWKLS